MMLRKLCLILIVVLVAACASPPPPPKPTNIILELDASGDMNPNSEGRSSPLAVRIYELKTLSDFNKADFVSLYGKDKGVLGENLLQKHEVVLQPGEKKTMRFVASDETRAIAAFAVFRDYEKAQWRASAPVQAHQTNQVLVTTGAAKVDMQSSVTGGTGK